MKTHSIFDIKRFGRLMAYDMRINGTAYLLKLAVLILFLYILLFTQMRQSPHQFLQNESEVISVSKIDQYSESAVSFTTNHEGYFSTFAFGIIFTFVFIGTSFTVMRNKINRTLFLQLPASTTEKYLYTFFIRFLVGLGVFFLVFWMDAQLARLTYQHVPLGDMATYFKNGILIKPDAFNYHMIFPLDDTEQRVLPFVLLSFASFLFACPLFFRKLQLLKTIFTFFAGVFLVVCLLVLFSHLFYPGEVQGFTIHWDEVWITSKYLNEVLAGLLLACLSGPFFLLIGYFRLKESTL